MEQNRDDVKHAMTLLCREGLQFTPIGNNPENIIDLGRNGLEVIEMDLADCLR
jgi:hypothetical protein